MKNCSLLLLLSFLFINSLSQSFDPEQDFPLFDLDHDGKIVYDEFLSYIKKLPEI